MPRRERLRRPHAASPSASGAAHAPALCRARRRRPPMRSSCGAARLRTGSRPGLRHRACSAAVRVPRCERSDEIVARDRRPRPQDPRRQLRAHVPGRSLATGTRIEQCRRRVRAVRGVREGAGDQGRVRRCHPGQAEQAAYADITGAQITVIAPPTVRGIGASGGFSLRVQDLEQPRLCRARKGNAASFSRRCVSDPRIHVRLHALRRQRTGVLRRHRPHRRRRCWACRCERVHETLEGYLGSAYVNDFNLSGRTYQVIAQAEGLNRLDVEQIGRLKAKSDSGRHGAAWPPSPRSARRARPTACRATTCSRPRRSSALRIRITVSSGAALNLVEEIAAKALPDGYSASNGPSFPTSRGLPAAASSSSS